MASKSRVNSTCYRHMIVTLHLSEGTGATRTRLARIDPFEAVPALNVEQHLILLRVGDATEQPRVFVSGRVMWHIANVIAIADFF
jgi:hypothetical protein